MSIMNHFYKGRVCLNVLANSIANAKEVYEAAEGYILVGVLSKEYENIEKAVDAMKQYGNEINNAVSIGLGAGDNRQASVVTQIAKHYSGLHINQVFPAVGATRNNLQGRESWINSLVSPSGKVGYVNISTGTVSAEAADMAIVPIKAAIALVRDMGGNALKFFPMNGLKTIEEYRAVAKACADEDFALEPTGGITKENFEEIVRIALVEKVPKIIPHVYSSIIDKDSGKTKKEVVEELLQIVKRLVDQNE